MSKNVILLSHLIVIMSHVLYVGGGNFMVKSKELRQRAWLSLKGKYWNAFLASSISGLILAVSTYFSQLSQDLSELIKLIEAGQIKLASTMFLGLNVIKAGVIITSIMLVVTPLFRRYNKK